ncbi:hypothetical protein Tco_1570274 [Tanacetum coccineum]
MKKIIRPMTWNLERWFLLFDYGDIICTALSVRYTPITKAYNIFWLAKAKLSQCKMDELLSDYDFVYSFHPGKANVVADERMREEGIRRPIGACIVVTVHTIYPSKIGMHKLKLQGGKYCAEGFVAKGNHLKFENDGTKCFEMTRFYKSRSGGIKLELYPPKLQGYTYIPCFKLKKVYSYEDLIIPLDEVRIDEKLHFIEEPIKIMDIEVKQLKQSQIPIVKVRWNSSRGPEYTWERGGPDVERNTPHLFDF